jgi:GxxExxY protein
MATVLVDRLSAQEVSHAVITAAMRVHFGVGAGLLESAYQACLQHELHRACIQAACQVGLPVVYPGVSLNRVSN